MKVERMSPCPRCQSTFTGEIIPADGFSDKDMFLRRNTGRGQQHQHRRQFVRQAGHDGPDLVDRRQRDQGHARLD